MPTMQKLKKMIMKKEILSIIAVFFVAGLVATTADAASYRAVESARDPQVEKIIAAEHSEFISSADKEKLATTRTANDDAESTVTRRTMRARMASEKKLLAAVQKRSDTTEAGVAQDEVDDVEDKLDDLDEQSEEAFILARDVDQLDDLKDELDDVEDATRVKPVRALAGKVDSLATDMTTNQSEAVAVVDQMKELNQQSAELVKKKYILDADKKAVAADQKENEKFFADADNLDDLTKRQETSQTLVTTLTTKQADSEKDFKDNEAQSKKLVQSTGELLKTGNLTADEKNKLTASNNALNNALGLKDYKPGALATTFLALKTEYDTSAGSSNKRNADAAAKKAADEKAAADKAAADKAAQEKAAAQQGQAVAAASSSPGAPTVSGGWTTAPAGWVYYRPDSGKTYRSVKNPQNYRLVTNAEAANYTPGHSNGSARN